MGRRSWTTNGTRALVALGLVVAIVGLCPVAADACVDGGPPRSSTMAAARTVVAATVAEVVAPSAGSPATPNAALLSVHAVARGDVGLRQVVRLGGNGSCYPSRLEVGKRYVIAAGDLFKDQEEEPPFVLEAIRSDEPAPEGLTWSPPTDVEASDWPPPPRDPNRSTRRRLPIVPVAAAVGVVLAATVGAVIGVRRRRARRGT